MRVIDTVLGPPTHSVEAVNAPKSAELYKMWHAKQADGAHVVPYEFPDNVMPIGKAHKILYLSDKYERIGDGHRYRHKFDSEPTVYAPANSPFFVRSNPTVPTEAVLKADINGKVELPMLALVDEFTFKDSDGQIQKIEFDDNVPLMCMTKDARGLVIFADFEGEPTPLFVRGGEMYVNSHGIIK